MAPSKLSLLVATSIYYSNNLEPSLADNRETLEFIKMLNKSINTF